MIQAILFISFVSTMFMAYIAYRNNELKGAVRFALVFIIAPLLPIFYLIAAPFIFFTFNRIMYEEFTRKNNLISNPK